MGNPWAVGDLLSYPEVDQAGRVWGNLEIFALENELLWGTYDRELPQSRPWQWWENSQPGLESPWDSTKQGPRGQLIPASLGVE